MIIKIIASCLIISLLSSCAVTYGNRISSSFTKLTSDSCKAKSNNVRLFFENEKVNFEYEKIGYVEVIGHEHSTNNEIFDYLKYEAWSNCANAVININSSFKERESGTLLSSEKSKNKYSAKVFNGLAVRIINDTSQVSNGTLFIKNVKKDYEESNKETSDELGFSIIGAMAIVFVAILLSVKK